MKISWRSELPQLLIILTMFAVAAWSWSRVPDRLPTHWNIRGEVDGYGGRAMGLLMLPAVAAGTYLLTLLLPLIDPGKSNYRNFAKAFNVIRIVLVMFFAVVYAVTLLAAFGHQVDMTPRMFLALALMFLVIGNFMSKIRPNWFVGVRTPWTLSSRLSWDKTHRLAGWLFALMGLLFAVAAVVNSTWTSAAAIVISLVCTVWIILYSYLVYRHDPDRTPPAGTSPGNE